jgi:ATP-dependent helicase/nuclease subunit B
MGAPRVFTIPAGMPFVDALAAGIAGRSGPEPEDLADSRVLLPTRRACRALGEAFLRRGGGRPLLLPRMTPLGDLDEDELALEGWSDTGALDLPPALDGLRRQMLLTRLVMAFEKRPGIPPEQAARLAAELARLLDQVRTERLDFARLPDLVPELHRESEHWRVVLDFLCILTERWPTVLEGEGAIDPADRRNRLLEAQAALWRARPPGHPVIAAGSTGTLPATADLLAVVASLPQGALVLPGLDREMDEESWRALEPTHPQYGMARLLARLEVDRRDVPDWPAPGLGATPPARVRLVAEALRTPETTHRWAEAPPPPPEALEGLGRVDCPTPREEAAAIALMLREVLETPGRRAALVTPDRGLARRVAAELERWGVEVDDSAGTPLSHTPPGAFLHLAAGFALAEAAPVSLLALLKHPLAGGGLDPVQLRGLARRLEVLALRGPRPAPGLAGLHRALHEAAGQRKQISMDLEDWLRGLEALARPLFHAVARKRILLTQVLEAHVAFAEGLAATATEAGARRLWSGEAGEAAATFVADLRDAARDFPAIRGADYPGLLMALMEGRVVRPAHGRHPRLAIWGLLEARLQQADRLVLGSLNEGSWPPEVRPGPWMSRPMQKEFGLPLPERRVGLAAHDFAQAISAPEVILTRSLRVDGQPTLPSRWLARLDNLLEGRGLAIPSAARWLHWAEDLDRPAAVRPRAPPRPAPPVEARPNRLSVTRVETWIRDPYALYADKILGLEPLDPLEADPGAAERGTAVHAALEAFLKEFPDHLPPDAEERLIDMGREAFGATLAWPAVRAFWWPRFRRIARWFVAREKARRAEGIRPLAVEARAEYAVPVAGIPFTLHGRADRIDLLPDGGLALVDYKTGVPPSWKEVRAGLAPQLPLEGAMAAAGAFEAVRAGRVEALTYYRLSGGREPGKETTMPEGDAPEVCRQALDGLARRVAAFRNPATPYLSRLRPKFANRPGDYDHLARVAEWSAGGEEEGE